MSFDQAVAYGHGQLNKVADRFDLPVDNAKPAQRAVLGIVLHAHHVFQAIFRDSQHDLPTSMLSLRALAEATILVRWFEMSPKLHVKMWQAEADRQALTVVRFANKMNQRRQWTGRPEGIAEPQAGRMRRRAQRIRVIAVARGEPLSKNGDECTPAVEVMALKTKDTAIWEAYEIIYRIANPWAHVGERVFAGYRFERRKDGTHIVPGTAWTGRSIRMVTVPLFAILLGSASRICDVGVEDECRIIQDAVAQWPTEAQAAMRPMGPGAAE